MTSSLVGFAERLIELSVIMPHFEAEGMEKAAAVLETAAKDLIGVPHPEWPPLAPVTIERKDGVNSPLLETGEMRDSITHNSDRREAYIGSNNEKLRFHEFGSDKAGNAWGSPNPPRPVLGLAVIKKGDEAAKAVGHEILAGLLVL